jgi:hypothetical protein
MNKKVVMGLFIAFIMIFSIFGFVVDFAARPSVQKVKYGDYKFRIVNQQYITEINGQERVFAVFPGDIEYISMPDDVRQLLSKPVLTVSYDPKSGIAENLGEAQYYFELQLQDVKVIERALTDNEGTELPQRTCADATESQPVIEMSQGDDSSIKAEGYCIKMVARDAFDLYQQTERIIYLLLGVMS